jgi:hypothetical protein
MDSKSLRRIGLNTEPKAKYGDELHLRPNALNELLAARFAEGQPSED